MSENQNPAFFQIWDLRDNLNNIKNSFKINPNYKWEKLYQKQVNPESITQKKRKKEKGQAYLKLLPLGKQLLKVKH